MMKCFARLFIFAVFASRAVAQTAPTASLQLSLKNLEAQARKIRLAATNEEKAKDWLVLNREAAKFAGEMNRAFPNTTIHGDQIDPPRAQRLAQQATSFGVKVDFCEISADWGASNEGYLKYLELWPTGPEADEATWMGPMGNQSFCGDFEASSEELEEVISQNRRFIAEFPNSRHTPEAKQRLDDAEKMLADLRKSQDKRKDRK
jgi:hypothetical protein